MPRIALGMQYDGRAFQGWQSQSHGHTVHDTLHTDLYHFANEGLPVLWYCGCV